MSLKRVSIREFSLEKIEANVNPAYSAHKVEIQEAISHHYTKNLSYDCDSGRTRNKDGHLAQYSQKSDIPKYNMIDDVLVDQFMSFINNSISRLLRGYPA